MIGGLSGNIIKILNESILLDVSGVAYKVLCPKHIIQSSFVGEQKFLYIETAVGDDFIKLYGFNHKNEQNWFLTLSSVQGVGAKAAFAILSAANLDDISKGVLFTDPAVFTRAQGVGPKLAGRIVNELKNKKDLPPTYGDEDEVIEFTPPKEESKIEHEVIPKTKKQDKSPSKHKAIEGAASALVNLGYQRMDAMRAVMEVSQDGTLSEGEIIHAALQQIGRMKENA